jgi:hypothetical protein
MQVVTRCYIVCHILCVIVAGLVDGYNAGCGAKSGEMKPIEFKFMNMNGDLFDIKAKFPTKKEEAVCRWRLHACDADKGRKPVLP